MRRYADMRENGVEKFASPLLKEALELDPPPQTTPPSDHLPPGKYPNPSLYASFMDHFVLYSLCVCVGGGGAVCVCVCHNLILDKLGTQNE